MGFSVLKIAEVARVDLAEFSLTGKKAHDFRYADRRAQKEGLSFEIIPRAEVACHIDQLRAVSDAWLEHKSGNEKGFSLGAFSPAYLSEFDCAVMRNDNGIQAFANIWRGAGKEEMSVDMMRYRPQSVEHPHGRACSPACCSMRRTRAIAWFNLGAAPLSGLEGSSARLDLEQGRQPALSARREFLSLRGPEILQAEIQPGLDPAICLHPRRLRAADRAVRHHRP